MLRRIERTGPLGLDWRNGLSRRNAEDVTEMTHKVEKHGHQRQVLYDVVARMVFSRANVAPKASKFLGNVDAERFDWLP